MKHIVTKQYRDLPAAHRQPNHDGHCRLIHGHNWGFDIIFGCDRLDENGFVVDVGKLEEVKRWLRSLFDHTLLLNSNDPALDYLESTIGIGQTEPFFKHKDQSITSQAIARICTVPNCGMEGLAEYVFGVVYGLIKEGHIQGCEGRNVRVLKVTCWEDSKNSATFKDEGNDLE